MRRTGWGGIGRAALTLVAFAHLWGCAFTPTVSRAYDGHVVDGRYIAPEAYAAFLRGVIAEARGDEADALAAYGEAARLDPQGVEIWTRIAAVRCVVASRFESVRDRGADDALTHAFAIDPGFAGAWSVKATCALARGDGATAREAAAKAVALDPAADGANVFLANEETAARIGQAREALVALTITAADPVLAWTALAAWAGAHGDVALVALSYERLVKVAPTQRDVAALAAEKLARAGQRGEACRVAAAAVDAEEAPLAPEHYALAARLAIDDAVARGDATLVRRRASRVRLSVEEASARALLAGNAALARDIAARTASADGDDEAVKLALAAGDRRDVLATLTEARRVHAPISGALWVAVGQALTFAVPPAEARSVLASLAHDPITEGDTLVSSRASEVATALAPSRVNDPIRVP